MVGRKYFKKVALSSKVENNNCSRHKKTISRKQRKLHYVDSQTGKWHLEGKLRTYLVLVEQHLFSMRDLPFAKTYIYPIIEMKFRSVL